MPPARDGSGDPVVNPLVEAALAAGGGEVLVIGGLAGPATEDHLRLYADLRLREYVDIPKEDVVRVVQDRDKPEQPCIVYFRGTARLRYARTLELTGDEAVAQARTAMTRSRCSCSGQDPAPRRFTPAQSVGGGGTGGGQGFDPFSCPSICDWAYGLCAEGADIFQWLWCVLEYVECMIDCQRGPSGPIVIS